MQGAQAKSFRGALRRRKDWTHHIEQAPRQHHVGRPMRHRLVPMAPRFLDGAHGLSFFPDHFGTEDLPVQPGVAHPGIIIARPFLGQIGFCQADPLLVRKSDVRGGK